MRKKSPAGAARAQPDAQSRYRSEGGAEAARAIPARVRPATIAARRASCRAMKSPRKRIERGEWSGMIAHPDLAAVGCPAMRGVRGLLGITLRTAAPLAAGLLVAWLALPPLALVLRVSPGVLLARLREP